MGCVLRPHFVQRSCAHCSTWFDLEAHVPGLKWNNLRSWIKKNKIWIHLVLESTSSICGQGRLEARGGKQQSWTNLEAAALQVECPRPAPNPLPLMLRRCPSPWRRRGQQAERRRGGHQLLRCNCCCGSTALYQVVMSHPLRKAVLNQVLPRCCDRS